MVQENWNVYHSLEEYLSNTHNEEHFIQYFKIYQKKLGEDGHSMGKCEEDAETHIDSSALAIEC